MTDHEMMQKIGELGIDNDKALLQVIQVLVDRVIALEKRVFKLEDVKTIRH